LWKNAGISDLLFYDESKFKEHRRKCLLVETFEAFFILRRAKNKLDRINKILKVIIKSRQKEKPDTYCITTVKRYCWFNLKK